jgi:hypothetical protein
VFHLNPTCDECQPEDQLATLGRPEWAVPAREVSANRDLDAYQGGTVS